MVICQMSTVISGAARRRQQPVPHAASVMVVLAPSRRAAKSCKVLGVVPLPMVNVRGSRADGAHCRQSGGQDAGHERVSEDTVRRCGAVLQHYFSFPGRPREALSYCAEMQL